jgi:PAS domain S-box-containing protein
MNSHAADPDALLRSALDSAGLGIHVWDPQTNVVQWDERLRRLWGVGPAEPIDFSLFWNGVHPEDRARIRAAIDNALDPLRGGRYVAEYRVIGRDDAVIRWIHATGQVFFEGGRAVRLVGTAHEITAQKEAEAALADSEARLRATFEGAPVGIAHVGLDGRWLRFNQATCRIVGRSRADLQQLSFSDITHPDDLEADWAQARRLMAGEIESYTLEKRYLRPDHSVVWVNLTVSMRRGASGEALHFISVIEDISARKRSEGNLAFLAELTAALAPVNGEREIAALACERILKHFGATRINLSDINSAGTEAKVYGGARSPQLKDDRTTHRLTDYFSGHVLADLAAGRTVVVEDVNADPRTKAHAGQYVQWDVRSLIMSPFLTDNVWNFLVVLHHSTPRQFIVEDIELLEEITARIHVRLERARAEQALRASEALLRSATEHVSLGLVMLNRERRYVFANAAYVSILRLPFSAAEVIGKGPQEVLGSVYASQISPNLDRAFAGERVSYELVLPFGAQGAEVSRYRVVYDPHRDADGLAGVIVSIIDITEFRRIEEALRAAGRQKDEFLAMLAHELRNPLAPILNAGALLTRIVGTEERVQAPLAMLTRQTRQLNRLVDDLLDVSRIAQGRIALQLESLEVDVIVAQAIEMVEPVLKEKRHRLRLEKADRLLYVRGDRARLVQSVGNLLHNAVKYTDPEGEIRLSVRDAKDMVELAVEDNGSGIPAELQPYVFDLFVQSERTLDRSQGGLGIGLAVVKRLIEMHGGRVSVSSAGLGQGTLFTLSLPRGEAPQPAAPVALAAPRRQRRVLIVDDNVDAADAIAMLLELEGHEARAIYDGRQALEVARTVKPEVVFVDIGLPNIDGYEVARQLRAHCDWGDCKLVALTGYGQHEDRQRSLAAGFDHHLVKPASAEELALAVDPGET